MCTMNPWESHQKAELSSCNPALMVTRSRWCRMDDSVAAKLRRFVYVRSDYRPLRCKAGNSNCIGQESREAVPKSSSKHLPGPHRTEEAQGLSMGFMHAWADMFHKRYWWRPWHSRNTTTQDGPSSSQVLVYRSAQRRPPEALLCCQPTMRRMIASLLAMSPPSPTSSSSKAPQQSRWQLWHYSDHRRPY